MGCDSDGGGGVAGRGVYCCLLLIKLALPLIGLLTIRQVTIFKDSEDKRLGIRFVREDDGFDLSDWGRSDVHQPVACSASAPPLLPSLPHQHPSFLPPPGSSLPSPSNPFLPRRSDVVLPIVAALDPNGDAARAGIEIDDMVLSINGQAGLSNTQAAAQLRELTGTLKIVVRKAVWIGDSQRENTPRINDSPETPRSTTRRLV